MIFTRSNLLNNFINVNDYYNYRLQQSYCPATKRTLLSTDSFRNDGKVLPHTTRVDPIFGINQLLITPMLNNQSSTPSQLCSIILQTIRFTFSNLNKSTMCHSCPRSNARLLCQLCCIYSINLSCVPLCFVKCLCYL